MPPAGRYFLDRGNDAGGGICRQAETGPAWYYRGLNRNIDVTLVYPAYNECATIRSTLEKSMAYFDRRGMSYEIVVAADGDDGTREAVSEMARRFPQLRAIGNKQRSGKGRGIREAIAISNGDIVGYADADYKVPIEEFDKIEPWFGEGYDVVIGSRALAESVIEKYQPKYRQWGSKAFRLLLHTVVGLKSVSDTQCGFKFFKRPVAREIFQVQRIDGYMFDVEILVLCEQFGFRIREIPIRWRDDGDSRLDLIRGNARNFADVMRIRLSRREYAVSREEVRARAQGSGSIY